MARLLGATPVFLVGDIAATIPWYADQLGFAAEVFPPRPPHAFCILRKDGVELFLQQLDGYRKPDHYAEREGGVWSVYLATDDAQGLYDRLRQLPGITIVQPLHRQPYGQLEFEVRDPNGYLLVFAEAV